MPRFPLHHKKSCRILTKTFNSQDSLMVTHSTTDWPLCSLNMPDRTGWLALCKVWSNAKTAMWYEHYICDLPMMNWLADLRITTHRHSYPRRLPDDKFQPFVHLSKSWAWPAVSANIFRSTWSWFQHQASRSNEGFVIHPRVIGTMSNDCIPEISRVNASRATARSFHPNPTKLKWLCRYNGSLPDLRERMTVSNGSCKSGGFSDQYNTMARFHLNSLKSWVDPILAASLWFAHLPSSSPAMLRYHHWFALTHLSLNCHHVHFLESSLFPISSISIRTK